MSITDTQLETYRLDGALRVEALFSDDEIDRIRRLIYRVYQKFEPEDEELAALDAPWNDPAFDRAMIALRKRDPKVFGALYDCAQSAVELLHLVADRRLVEVAAACLEDVPDALSFSGAMLRMDPPRDTRNSIDWHQDRAYYPQNREGGHGLVATVAMQDIDAADGALEVCLGSHLEGLVAPKIDEKFDYESTEQRKVPEERVAQYGRSFAELRKGDVYLMNLNLFHRSGYNERDRFRYTALCRFHRIMANDYVPFGLLYNFNGFMEERVGNQAPKTASD